MMLGYMYIYVYILYIYVYVYSQDSFQHFFTINPNLLGC